MPEFLHTYLIIAGCWFFANLALDAYTDNEDITGNVFWAIAWPLTVIFFACLLVSYAWHRFTGEA